MFFLCTGKWLCPWHHCDLPKCGKRARKLCVLCPNSYCNHHLEGKIFQLPDSRLICFEHRDLVASEGGTSLKNVRRRSSASPRKSSSVGTAADAPPRGETSSAPGKKDAAGVEQVQSELSTVDAIIEKTDAEETKFPAVETETPSCGSRTRLKRKASEKDASCHAGLTNGNHAVNGLSKGLAAVLCDEKMELDGGLNT